MAEPRDRTRKSLVSLRRPWQCACQVALTVADRMRRVRRRDTAPETEVRRLLWKLGVAFRVCAPRLPGRPDISNQRAGWAIFVHGCFWHGHHGCALFRIPRANRSFWVEKVEANRGRDSRKTRELERLGIRVLTVWQCELRDKPSLERRMARFVNPLRALAPTRRPSRPAPRNRSDD